MEGLAKSAEQTQTVSVAPAKDTKPINIDTNIVHDEIYKFFNISPLDNMNKGHINTINRWVSNSNGIGDGLKKLMVLESKLGVPAHGETRVSKLYNWIRLSDNIDSLRGEMNKELNTIKQSKNQTLSSVTETYKSNIAKLNMEIDRITKTYAKAEKQFKLNATETSKNIKNKYSRRLDELKEMRVAYRGKNGTR